MPIIQKKPENSYQQYCKPKLAELLHHLKLDQKYVKATGCDLFTEDGKHIIDFIGGFGATIAGHNHPALKEVIHSALDEDIPIQVQVSLRQESGLLAARLNTLTPGETGYFICFTNSGTESIEAVLKHAYKVHFEKVTREFERMCRILNDFYYSFSESKADIALPENKKLLDFRNDIDEYNLEQYEKFQNNPTVIAFKGAFHGKSTSSLKITFNKSYREGFQGLSAINTVFIDPTDFQRLPELVRENRCNFYYPVIDNNKVELRSTQLTTVIAFIFEPILGEGGILPLPDETLCYLADNHRRLGIPYIIDEIQTGCGRTGTFYNYEQTPLKDIEPEYLVLSKALGGGIAKIGASLIRKDIYDQDFGILHTSTFGEDDFSARIALRFLDLLLQDESAMMRDVKEKGAELKRRLEQLKMEFPSIVKEVRGKGLMIGVEFTDLRERSPFFRISGRQGFLSLLVASYLLEHHGIRLLAPLTTMLKGNPGKIRKSVLRIQPAAIVTEEHMEKLVIGLHEVLRIISSNNEYSLIGHLAGEQVSAENRSYPRSYANAWPATEELRHIDSRIGFIVHPTSLNNLVTYFFPSFSDYTSDFSGLHSWWNGISRFLEPVHVKTDYVTSNGFAIESNLVLVPYLPDYITAEKPDYLTKEVRDKIQDAVVVAKELGDENIPLTMVGLGAYTSIATNNGLTINDYEMCITTGNAFTVALTIEGLKKAAAELGKNWKNISVAIVGASGNIGQAVARVLAPQVRRLVLIGSSRANSSARLEFTKKLCVEEIVASLKKKHFKDDIQFKGGSLRDEVIRIVNNHTASSIPSNAELTCLLGADHIAIATTFDALSQVDSVVIATNSADSSLIRPEMVRKDAIVCCTSTPTNLHKEFGLHKNILAFEGGITKLPESSEIRFVGLPENGMTYGCLAEALLLGFDGYNHSFAKGVLQPPQVYQTLDWAATHGFGLGPLCFNGSTIVD